MNNYEYIVAGLPVLQQGPAQGSHDSAARILSSIREQLSSRDNELVDLLLSGYESENLNAEFYSRALSHRNRFIREFFSYDLDLRNVKVEYLNKSLGRPADMDTVVPAGREDESFEGRQEVMAVLENGDILIDPSRAPQNGSVAVVSIDGSDYVMRRMYRGASTLVLSPESWDEGYEDIVVTASDDTTVEFHGTVVWFQPSEEME